MKKVFAIILIGIILLKISASATFAIGINGSFEIRSGANTSLYFGDTTLNDWNIDSGSVELINSYWVASDGVWSLDMNGNSAGSISQNLTTTIGTKYNIGFDMSANFDSGPSDKILRVMATGTDFQDYHYDSSIYGNTHEDMKWQRNYYSFTATETTTILSFASQTSGFWGPTLDNVIIEEVNLATPTVSSTPTIIPSPSPSPSLLPSPTPTATATATLTASPTQSPTFNPVPTQTAKPRCTPKVEKKDKDEEKHYTKRMLFNHIKRFWHQFKKN